MEEWVEGLWRGGAGEMKGWCGVDVGLMGGGGVVRCRWRGSWRAYPGRVVRCRWRGEWRKDGGVLLVPAC